MNDPHSVMRGQLRQGVPLGDLTTLRIGGPADWHAVPATEEDVRAIVLWAQRQGVPWLPIGLGSNLLCPDAGYRGLLLSLERACAEVAFEGTLLRVGAGAHLAQVLNAAARHGLSGLQDLAGVPGSVGGALAMNAGTARGDISAVVRSVRVLLPTGDVTTWSREELAFAYRTSRLQRGDALALSAELALVVGESIDIRADLRQRLDRRRRTQPLEYPNAGSIWRNPPGDHAGHLVEAAGCKGWRVGGAEVSAKHANFIINRGGALATDVVALMGRVRRAVGERFGVRLVPEIRYLHGQDALEVLLDAVGEVNDGGENHGPGG